MAELLSFLIVFFFLCCITSVIAVIITENPKFIIGVVIFLALVCVCICMLPLPNKNPSKLYQEKIEAVEKANKELEKFLIDYPEFKGIK